MIQDGRISEYFTLRPQDFPILDRLEIIRVAATLNAAEQIGLSVHLSPLEKTVKRRMEIRFDNVRAFQFVQPSLSQVTIPVLEISSIRDSQWDGMFYKVHDRDDVLAFYCSDFEAKVIEYTSLDSSLR